MVLAALRGCFGPAGVPRVPWVLLVALRGCHSPCRGAAGCVACCSKHCYAASGNPQTCSLRNDSSPKIFSRKRVLVDIWFLDLCSLLVPYKLSSTRMCMWSFLFKANNKLFGSIFGSHFWDPDVLESCTANTISFNFVFPG